MKKFWSAVVFSLLLPISAFSMNIVEDAELSNITGQAGVSIEMDLTMDISISTMAWGDASGLDPLITDSAGYVGMRNFNVNGLIISTDTRDIWSAYWQPVTIDVGTMEFLGYNLTAVRFGLGALRISCSNVSMYAGLGSQGSAIDQTLGELQIHGLTMYVDPVSEVWLYNGRNGGCGISFDMNMYIDSIYIESVSWGDTDGFEGSERGYIGLADFDLRGMIIQGSAYMDVYTTNFGTGHTAMRISYPSDMYIDAGAMIADVRLGSNPSLHNFNTGTLGSVYTDFDLTILGGSYIDVFAH